MSYTCDDCRRICDGEKDSICANFEANDGKRPRFCRLANSVDDMAEAMVIKMIDDGSLWSLAFVNHDFKHKEEAIAVAKAWLMEVDE